MVFLKTKVDEIVTPFAPETAWPIEVFVPPQSHVKLTVSPTTAELSPTSVTVILKGIGFHASTITDVRLLLSTNSDSSPINAAGGVSMK